MSIVVFTVLVTLMSLGLGLLITLVGLPILLGTAYVNRWFADAERGRAGSSCASASAGGTWTGRAAGSGTACESWRPTRRRGRTRGSWCSAWSARVRGAGPDHRRVLAVLAYLREAR